VVALAYTIGEKEEELVERFFPPPHFVLNLKAFLPFSLTPSFLFLVHSNAIHESGRLASIWVV